MFSDQFNLPMLFSDNCTWGNRSTPYKNWECLMIGLWMQPSQDSICNWLVTPTPSPICTLILACCCKSSGSSELLQKMRIQQAAEKAAGTANHFKCCGVTAKAAVQWAAPKAGTVSRCKGREFSGRCLKGQCHGIFCFWFFSWISFPPSPRVSY